LKKAKTLLASKRVRHHFNIYVLFICASAINITFHQKAMAQQEVSIEVFYRELSPYGTWVQHDDYGFVWVPHHHRDFYPYGSGGYWLYTSYGWTWVSDYSWGWAPFHYGRWFYDPFYGWVWVPGYHWGPAWVTWRYCPGYYGWAPLGPDIGFDLAFSSGYYIPYEHWHFIHQHDLGRRDVEKRILGMGGYIKYLNESKVIENVKQDSHHQITFHAGPKRTEVERITKRKITPVVIENASSPVQLLRKSSLKIYRPELQQEKLPAAVAQPKQFENWNDNTQPAKIEIKEEHHPVKQMPETDLPVKQAPVIQQQEVNQQRPEIIKPQVEENLPKKDKPVIQPPRQQQIKPDIIQPPPPRQEIKPVIEEPRQPKPVQQRPLRQRINETRPVDNPPPVRKSVPQERPVIKQTLPPLRKP